MCVFDVQTYKVRASNAANRRSLYRRGRVRTVRRAAVVRALRIVELPVILER